jgi:hypothetical protein
MPPQPLSKVNPNATVVAGNAGHRVLFERPALAVLAMEGIASFSNVESFLLRLFVRIFGGDESLAARIYLTLDGQGPKTAVLAEAIKAMPDQRYAALTTAIVGISKSNQQERDKLAHRVFGLSPNLPDALLLIDPKAMIADTGIDRSKVWVYKANDFERIITANDRLCGHGMILLFILNGHPANQEDRLYDQLCKEPEVRERLDRQAAQARSARTKWLLTRRGPGRLYQPKRARPA